MEGLFSNIIETLQEDTEEYNNKVDFIIRSTKYFLELAEDQRRTK
jgi:hypothetical protein